MRRSHLPFPIESRHTCSLIQPGSVESKTIADGSEQLTAEAVAGFVKADGASETQGAGAKNNLGLLSTGKTPRAAMDKLGFQAKVSRRARERRGLRR
jgi:hypothetical protein